MPVERIRVVPNGVDAVFSPDGPAADGDYVLAVGTLEPRKNLPAAVEAARLAGVELRVVGAAGWGERRDRRAGSASRRTRSWPRSIAARAVSSTRRSTRASASPILEAMACGTPVVTSRGGATEEVAGGAAVLVDASDPEAIAAGIEEAEARRESSSRSGSSARLEFTWQPFGRPRRGAVAGAHVTELVVVDADVLGRERTGDETYVRNLLRELPGLAAEAGLRLAAVTRHPELVPDGRGAARARPASQELRMSWALPRLLRRVGAALVHTQYAVPLRCPCPAVVTVHDVSFERDPTLMRSRDRARLSPRRARGPCGARRASSRSRSGRSATWSSSTASHPSASSSPRTASTPPSAPARPGQGTGYALAVGAIQERKNQLAALAAAREVGLPLVVVGPTKDAALAAELRAGGARLEGYVPIERLAELYRGAACLVQASRYEGFGLPVLEAMATGTPVVTVPDPALVEVVGDAAVVVAEESLADGIRRALAGARPARRGRARACACLLLGGDRRGDRRGLRRGARPMSGFGGRRLARARRGGRDAAARARAAGGRARRDREPPGLGSASAPSRGARPRERPSPAARREREPRHRRDERRVGRLRQSRRRSRRPARSQRSSAFGETRDRCGIAGPRTVWPDGSWQPSRRRFPTVRGTIVRRTPLRRLRSPLEGQRHHYLLDETSTTPVEADWMLGAFLLMRRAMLDELRGWDEGYRHYVEDIDLCYRAMRAGWERWYVPAARVTHDWAQVIDRRFARGTRSGTRVAWPASCASTPRRCSRL